MPYTPRSPRKRRKFKEKIRIKIVKAAFCLLAATVLGAAVLPSARADESNKKTIVTFSQAMEVPGKSLPAGTYTFQLLDSPADRHIVQIFNADGSQVITTVLAINDYRLQPAGQTVLKFTGPTGDSPDALRAWFNPGDGFGQEFVYPKARALQLAQTMNTIVPSVAADTLDDSSLKTVAIVAVTPDQKVVDIATAIQTAPPPPHQLQSRLSRPRRLPQHQLPSRLPRRLPQLQQQVQSRLSSPLPRLQKQRLSRLPRPQLPRPQ